MDLRRGGSSLDLTGMEKVILGMLLATTAFCTGYEIPKGMVGVSELEKAQQKAKESNKPLVLVVAIKTQPET